MLHKPCRSTSRVAWVEVSDGAKTLWRVSSTAAAPTGGDLKVILGHAPPGFIEEVSLTSSLPGAVLVEVRLDSGHRSQSELIRGRLSADGNLLLGGYANNVITEDAFWARNTCD